MPNSKTPTITTVEQFLHWTKELKGRDMLYRGLADAAWKVEASAYRRLRESQGKTTATPEAVLVNATRRLLDQAGLLGFYHRDNRKLSDLELLAQLQHNGAATCLIDFTEVPLIALWFACWGEPDKDGQVVALAAGDVDRFAAVNYEDLADDRKIESFLGTDKLWKWRPEHLGSRITAQYSCFVFGRGEIPADHYDSVKVDAQSKANIRRELEDELGITEPRLFSDFAGFCTVNAHGRGYPDFTAEDYMHWGNAFQQAGELPQAIVNYDLAIERDPKNAEAYSIRAAAKGDSGDLQGAIADCNRAISIDSRSSLAYNNRGVAKFELGDLQGALADYNRAIAIDPQDALVYNNRGEVKAKLGDLQGAIADYDRAISIDPEDAEAYYNRGLTKRDGGDEAGAAEDLATARRLAPGLWIANNG